ncbi:MAG: hypothetical protein PVI30_13310 [Myxococcales bacterium]|jgi:hypothetical protein
MRQTLPLVSALLLLSGAACGGDDGGGTGGDYYRPGDAGAGMARVCMDADNDGFGRNCEAGRDCDDDDPELTDECYRCVMPNVDCPCEPGTKPAFCKPDDQEVVMDGIRGILMCSEGTRYCRDGLWSECEILLQYATFVPLDE